MEYFVEPGPYQGGLLFTRELTGAFFYVLPADIPRAREILVRAKYKPYDETVHHGGAGASA